MDPIESMVKLARARLPRVSGDGPVMEGRVLARVQVAPRERGWTQAEHLSEPLGIGCPA